MKHLTKKLLTMKVVLLATVACGEGPTAPPPTVPGSPYDIIQEGEEIPRPPNSVWVSTTNVGSSPSDRVALCDHRGTLA